MSVIKIEEYTQQNGVDILKVYCKPTKKFPEGKNFFYAPAEAIGLVNKFTWNLCQKKNRHCITVIANINNMYTTTFHQELFKFYHGYYWNKDIDHINMIDYDNTDSNLNAVSSSQNRYNTFRKGYSYIKGKNYFRAEVFTMKIIYPFGVTRGEDTVCRQQSHLEHNELKDFHNNVWYMFDFKKYRRGSEDILDLERTGQISEEEAIYRHILRYSENAWYMLRYGLEEYYKENHIPIPKYSLDADGFMIHPITGQKLCPFAK